MVERFRRIGIAEGTSFLVLLGIAMPLKYLAGLPLAVRFVGSAHGALFIAYIIYAHRVAAARGWPLSRLALAYAAAVLPLGTFVFERNFLTKRALSAEGGKSVKHRPRLVARWLFLVCLMIVAMIAVGGITRLTGSGLSITEWKPIMGAIPPLNDGQWLEAFDKYKQIPQYKLVNAGMTLAGFKWLFFWEYVHRLLGRSFALALIVPWIVLSRRRLVSRVLHRRLATAFTLFFLQGVMGWVMVASGLSERTSVSHFRLAAHLMLALMTLGYLLWMLRQEMPWDERKPGNRATAAAFARLTTALIALVGLQIIYGALMAGLKAGYMYATFPTMNGAWVPLGAFEQGSMLFNALENPAAVHFIHRTLGWGVLMALAVFASRLRARKLPGEVRGPAILVVALGATQFALGVLTVLTHVSIVIAVAHQIGGALLLSALLWTRYSTRNA